jgi:hypothetical protein
MIALLSTHRRDAEDTENKLKRGPVRIVVSMMPSARCRRGKGTVPFVLTQKSGQSLKRGKYLAKTVVNSMSWFPRSAWEQRPVDCLLPLQPP